MTFLAGRIFWRADLFEEIGASLSYQLAPSVHGKAETLTLALILTQSYSQL